MNGYKEANAIDKQILQLIEKEPLTMDNSLEWLNFTRTIKTGLDLINKEAIALRNIHTCPTCGNVEGL